MQTHSETSNLPALANLQQRGLLVGIVALALGVIGAFFNSLNSDRFFQSWLIGFLFILGLSLGSLGLLMLQHLSGGKWGLAGRRVFEAGAGTLWLVALAFIPILFGLRPIFLWARPEAVQADLILTEKAPYLNTTFFIVRAVVYFAFWLLCAFLLNKWSAAQDRGEAAVTPADTVRFRTLSAPGLLFLVLTVSLASVDWIMSVDPKWYSTIFGLLTVVGQGLSALAFAIAILALVARSGVFGVVLSPGQFHDLGKLLLAFVMLWAYMAFSQFLIIWSGNLPEEIDWYIMRIRGGWGVVALLIVVGHFALPFVLLLSRNLKRRSELLARVAVFVIAMRLVDLIWLVVPTFTHNAVEGEGHPGFSIPLHWMNIVVPIGLAGVWLFFFARQLRSRSLVPLNDPYFKEAFAHESH
jgi:hypothetical protein